MRDLNEIELVYRRQADGTTHTQPLSDLSMAGCLIDPHDGSELDLVGWQFAGEVDDFVIVEGGLVQNAPVMEVFDLDVLSSTPIDDLTLTEVHDLTNRLAEHLDATEPRRTATDLTALADRVRTFHQTHCTLCTP